MQFSDLLNGGGAHLQNAVFNDAASIGNDLDQYLGEFRDLHQKIQALSGKVQFSLRDYQEEKQGALDALEQMDIDDATYEEKVFQVHEVDEELRRLRGRLKGMLSAIYTYSFDE